MGTYYAIMMVAGVVLYAWLWYRCMILAGDKKFSKAATLAIGLLTTPLVALIIVTFLPDPAASSERRLTTEELTAVFEAKAARIEAAKARNQSAEASQV